MNIKILIASALTAFTTISWYVSLSCIDGVPRMNDFYNEINIGYRYSKPESTEAFFFIFPLIQTLILINFIIITSGKEGRKFSVGMLFPLGISGVLLFFTALRCAQVLQFYG